MTKREKQLLLTAGILAFLVLVPLLYSLYGSSSPKVFAQRNGLRKEVEELQKAVQKKEAIQKKLTEYMDQSLPPMAARTRDFYHDHLGNLVKECGFQESKVTWTGSNSAMARSNKNGYQTFSFKITGSVSLEGLTNLLKQFYGIQLLHLIKSLSITPVDQSNKMSITMEIEAIAIDTSKKNTIDWIKNPDTEQTLGDYARLVKERALFSVYRPPTPPRGLDPGPVPPEPQKFTEAMHTYVHFIADVNGVYEVQLDRRLKGDKLRLKVGDRFVIDGTGCIVREIRFDRIVIGILDEEDGADPADEMLLTIRLGKNFNEFDEPT